MTTEVRRFYNENKEMEWKLSHELLDQIIFAMENQASTFYLDIRSGHIYQEDQLPFDPDDDRYRELPVWRSLEGFQMMERFVDTIRNPLFREELRRTLSEGRGVFRAFKNALKQWKELEQLWFSFKENEMRRVVLDWVSDLKEIEGLEKLEIPEDETDELILSDFTFTRGAGHHLADIRELDREMFYSAYSEFPIEKIEEYYRMTRARQPDPGDDNSLVVAVETPGGRFAGFAWGTEQISPLEGTTDMELIQLTLLQEYQDLGLGKALLKEFIQAASETGTAKVRINLSQKFLGITRIFEREGFYIAAQQMELDLTLREQQR